MPNMTIELTENERLFLIFALGISHHVAAVVSDPSAPPANAIELARRLVNRIDRPPASVPQPQGVVQPTAEKPRPIPADAREFHILPDSIVKIGSGEKERLVVEGKSAGVTKKASCWSSSRDIWPRVLEKVKQPATFLVVEKSGYLNIVGVK